jgi:membrane-associated phospholipid phosphatase
MLYQIAGRTGFGLMDPQLAAIDRWAHFNTAYITHAVDRVPLLAACFMVVYCLFGPMTLAALTVPALCGYGAASQRFFVGILLGLFFGAAISSFIPAAGPWTTESIQPSRLQAGVTGYLHRLKSGLPVAVEKENEGMVSFPSLHVIFAILAAQALGTVRPLRRAAWGICVMICISTLATGWHYGVDVLCGVAVALISGTLARRLCRFLDGLDIQDAYTSVFRPGSRKAAAPRVTFIHESDFPHTISKPHLRTEGLP